MLCIVIKIDVSEHTGIDLFNRKTDCMKGIVIEIYVLEVPGIRNDVQDK